MMKVYIGRKVLEEGTRENNYAWYYEYLFNEYDEEGNLIRTGAEDFNGQRARNLNRYEVREYNGRLNKAGGKMRDQIAFVFANKNVAPRMIAAAEYNGRDVKLVKC